MITKSNFTFLKNLAKNNDREWFGANKTTYEAEYNFVISFADELLALMNKHDKIENQTGKKSVMRIYRDVRFSKDKSPYKSHWGIHFKRATKQLRGGYYLHIEPGNTFVGAGFWGPEPSDLKLIREGISADEKTIRKILNSKSFIENFGEYGLHGEALKSVPKGFDANDAAADLIKLKQFLIRKDFKDEEVLSADFAKKANEAFKAMRPFFDFMSYTLTHDSNGIPLF
ncbi:MAG: DUF2461 domain-containing protein [Flavobacteriales bacterium]